MNPLISVALCTYNGERYIQEQIDSIVSQSYENIEIIILDDNSTDGTVDLVKSYKDIRLKVHINDQNIGFNKNFQKCLSLCTGEYICISDQDDIWLPDKVSKLYSTLGGSIMAYSDSKLIDYNGDTLHISMSSLLKTKFENIASPLQLIFRNTISGHSMIFHRKLLLYALPVPNDFFYDWWLAYTAAAIDQIKYCESALVSHRQHSSSVIKSISLIGSSKKSKYRKLLTNLETFLSLNHLKPYDKEFLKKLYDLEKRRLDQKLSIELFSLLIKNTDTLFPKYKYKSFLSKINNSLKGSKGI
jgi:glycosyltransferase involved in cell wall biosynthesis